MKLGLLGSPIEHSLSGVLHRRAMELSAISGEYNLIETQAYQLREQLRILHNENYHGLNLTSPLKEVVLPLLSECSSRALLAGSVNTLVREKHGWRGDSTDGEGVLFAISKFDPPPKPGVALILGAGGAARAAAAALCFAGWRVIVSARREEQAQYLVDELSAIGTLDAIAWESRTAFPESLRLIVNCTIVGNDGVSNPLTDLRTIPNDLYYVDALYSPRVTPLQTELHRRGVKTQNGIQWLIGQASASWKIWTQINFPASAAEALESEK